MSLESAAVARSSEITSEERKVLVATLVGTTIEWYDFFVYAQATGLVFASLFFAPMNQNNPLLAQIVSFATLGLSFLFRPLGAIVCGSLGDRFGRKNVLVATLVLMGAATALVGVLPTYSQISSAGASAPIDACPGSTAIMSEPAHIISTEMTSDVRRPRRSAILPKIQPPIGRIRNPAAKTPAALSNWAVSLPFGKNTGAK